MRLVSNGFIILLVGSFIVHQFFPLNFLYYTIAILTAYVMIVTIFYSKPLPRIFSMIMFLVGCFILLFQGSDLQLWMESVLKNLPLVCLIMMVPILSIPINIGKYDDEFSNVIAKFNKKPSFLFFILYSLFYLLGPITNLGSLYILHSMIKKMKLPVEFMARLFVRGFSSINTWAPYFASVFLVVYYLEIPMIEFLPYGLGLSFLQMLMANAVFSLKEVKGMKLDLQPHRHENENNRLWQLVTVFLLLLACILLLENLIPVNVSVVIILSSVIFAVLWSVSIKKGKPFIKEANGFFKNIIPRQATEVALFLCAGFFASALTLTAISDFISSVWMQLANFSIFLLIILTIVLVSVLSFLWIHQLVIISAILASISPAALGLQDVVFAMILLSSWAIGSTMSPITPMNVITSNLVNVNVYRIIHWNLFYTIILLFVHTTFIYVVYVILN